MPAYKDEKNGTWYVKFRYKDWTGSVKNKMKRGFETKRDATNWENDFKVKEAGDLEMTLKAFIEIYKKECFPRLKESTQVIKENIISTHIIPSFGEKNIKDISSRDIIRWQNNLLTKVNPKTEKKYSKSYLQTIHNQINAIFNYACKFYKLRSNPASIAGTIGGEDEIKTNFWTLEEFLKFSEEMMLDPIAYYAFQILYWVGCREGELLALKKSDFNFDTKELSITKTYQVIKGEGKITTPKTAKSNRTVSIPNVLCEELKEFFEKTPYIKKNDRIFAATSKKTLLKKIKKGAKAVGIKQIRVHDLRHSHVSLLIHMGYSAVAIANRMGHESIHVTCRYAHMFPSVQTDMADKLNKLMIEEKEGENNG